MHSAERTEPPNTPKLHLQKTRHHRYEKAPKEVGKRKIPLTGPVQQSQTCVDIFANHVLLDAILMTVPRVIFCAFLSSLPGTLCEPSDFPSPFRPPTSPSLPSSAGHNAKRATSPDRCFVVMNTLMGVAAFLAVASGAAQWSVALRVREFAKSLSSDGQDGRDVEEKAGAGLEDACVAEERYLDEKKAAVVVLAA